MMSKETHSEARVIKNSHWFSLLIVNFRSAYKFICSDEQSFKMPSLNKLTEDFQNKRPEILLITTDQSGAVPVVPACQNCPESRKP